MEFGSSGQNGLNVLYHVVEALRIGIEIVQAHSMAVWSVQEMTQKQETVILITVQVRYT